MLIHQYIHYYLHSINIIFLLTMNTYVLSIYIHCIILLFNYNVINFIQINIIKLLIFILLSQIICIKILNHY